jgi:hypothetical protein
MPSAALAFLAGRPPDLVWDALAAQVEAAGYRLVADDRAAGIAPAHGLTDHLTRAVCVRSDLPTVQRLAALVHQLAHVRLHSRDRRHDHLTDELAELEAESVAHLVTRATGLDRATDVRDVADVGRASAAADAIARQVGGWLRGDRADVPEPVGDVATDPRSVVPANDRPWVPDAAVFTGLPGPDPAVLVRLPDGTTKRLAPGRPWPTESFGWGYDGDAAAILAYSMLAAVAGAEAAETHWPAVTHAVVANLPADFGWELPASVLSEWARRTPVTIDEIGPRRPDATDPPTGPVRIDTPSGWWRFGWEPSLATLYAQHRASGDTVNDEPAIWFGAEPLACPTVGSLEERLGFALPHVVRIALESAQRTRPAADVRGYEFLRDGPDGDADSTTDVPGARERPDMACAVRVPGEPPTTYRAALLASPALRSWAARLEGGQRGSAGCVQVEILAAAPTVGADGEAAGQLVAYRLSHEGRVVFSGDDITAPDHVDPGSDDAVRAVVDMLCQPDGVALTPSQRAFLNAHADAVIEMVRGPDPPYPPGTRVTVTADGTGTATAGTVMEAVDGKDGQVAGYVWRPDAADLPGHPWQHNPNHGLVSAAEHVSPALPPTDVGADMGALPSAPRGRPAPATVTIIRDGDDITVGDPRHGWITTRADRLAAALTRPPADMAGLLRTRAPGVRLLGAEPPITLAALAAHHLPDRLPAPACRPQTVGDAQLANDL